MRSSFLSTQRPTRRLAGFTLIELMITMAIIAILASIAIPSYTSYIARAHRADARTQLVQVAQFMQRFYAATDSYKEDRALKPVIEQIPDSLKNSPPEGTALYTLAIPTDTLDAMKFTLQMVPVSTQKMADDECGTFTLTSTGIKGVLDGATVGDAALRDTCWK